MIRRRCLASRSLEALPASFDTELLACADIVRPEISPCRATLKTSAAYHSSLRHDKPGTAFGKTAISVSAQRKTARSIPTAVIMDRRAGYPDVEEQ